MTSRAEAWVPVGAVRPQDLTRVDVGTRWEPAGIADEQRSLRRMRPPRRRRVGERPPIMAARAEVLLQRGRLDREAELAGVIRAVGIVAHRADDAQMLRIVLLLVIRLLAPRLQDLLSPMALLAGRIPCRRLHRFRVRRERPLLGNRLMRSGVAFRATVESALHVVDRDGNGGERMGGVHIGVRNVCLARAVAALALDVGELLRRFSDRGGSRPNELSLVG